MKKSSPWWILISVLIVGTLVLSACKPTGTPTAFPEELLQQVAGTQMARATEMAVATLIMKVTQLSMPTITPTPTIKPTSTETPLPTQTPTITVTPFVGFGPHFKFYRAWIDADNTTVFYFMNAEITGQIIGGVIKEDVVYDLVCDNDPNYPMHMICRSDKNLYGKSELGFEFYKSEYDKEIVIAKKFSTGLSDESYYLFGNCESEYRIYDGKCYYAHTCYDDSGNVIYSADNIPSSGNFEGYSVPCN